MSDLHDWGSNDTEADRWHACRPPMRHGLMVLADGVLVPEIPDGWVSDLWRCPLCSTLWEIQSRQLREGDPRRGFVRGVRVTSIPVWRPAGWWRRWRNRGRSDWVRRS